MQASAIFVYRAGSIIQWMYAIIDTLTPCVLQRVIKEAAISIGHESFIMPD